ncbi:MAG: Sip1-related alpha-galactosidase [Pyrinomonadaceae bacterium]
MPHKRIPRLSLFVLLAFSTCSFHAVVHGQTSAPLSVSVNKGTLQLRRGADAVISNVKLRLRLADGAALLGELAAAGQDNGADEGGRYERQRYRLRASTASSASANGVTAVLELRRYLQPEVLVATLDYAGPALAARDGVQLIMSLDAFARGLALKRLKLYWTAPMFVADHRLLAPANQLLLWRQVHGADFHLLVPLAGDGMVSEVGVAEIDYRYEFRVASSSYDPTFAPRRVPLFAYAAGDDPYRLPHDAYQTAFAATNQYGRLRWQKDYPAVFRALGWCSWNAYEHEVTEDKILASVRSLRAKQVPLGFVLVDDGWLNVTDNKLTDYDADRQKFPHGLAGLARTLRTELQIPHVGVWHTFQGYWSGVDAASEIGRAHALLNGLDGKTLPDPRAGRGENFYADWYARLKEWGFDFVKVDGQANNIKFTDGLMPLFDSGGGTQRNLQTAAQKKFADGGTGSTRAAGLSVINCMEMTLENAFNWRLSNVARNSDDYLPDNPQNAKEHIYQNAYNAYWTSNFAYPDWDMFQSHDPHAEYHAVARAISGGPIYVTDKPGRERAGILRRLAFDDGRLLMLDEPGQVTRDLLLDDPALAALPLKVFGRITRDGVQASMVAAFNVNKSARQVTGALHVADVAAADEVRAAAMSVAVYQRSNGRIVLLNARQPALPFSLDEFGFDLFTLVPTVRGFAAFGLLDKYVGPAAINSQRRERNEVVLRLSEAGDFGAWAERAPARVSIDGQALAPNAYSYNQGLLRVPQPSFGPRTGEHELRISLAP